MKQNIIMIGILIALFVFGLLIYDFSDELDKKITNHKWYLYENNTVDVMSFTNNEFSYYNLDSKKTLNDYRDCVTYRYNKSIKVIKLNCSILGNKIYIESFNDETLKITVEGKEKILYSTKEKALIESFKEKHNLTEEEYQKLVNVDFNKYNYLMVDEIISLYKGKTIKKIALINTNVTYLNALSFQKLDEYLKSNEVSFLNVDNLTEEEATKLSNISELFSKQPKDYIKSEINIYEIGKKQIKLIDTMESN